MDAFGWFGVALSITFAIAGVSLTLRALQSARAREAVGHSSGILSRVRAYVGPVEHERVPLSATVRIAAEFFLGALGFPGLGWMLSGHIAVGLTLLIAVPAILWALYPMYLGLVPKVGRDPLQPLLALPILAMFSAVSLAIASRRDA